MKSILFILGTFAMIGLTGCRCSTTENMTREQKVSEVIAETRLESEIRKDSLIQYLQASDLCNACKGNVITEESLKLRWLAQTTQTEIEGLLKDDVLLAFQNERAAYQEWNDHQKQMSDIVVSTLWDTFAGGSAGGSFQVVYLYDIENLNFEDMEYLLFHLLDLPGETRENSSLPSIEQFREQWNLVVRHILPIIQNESDYKKVLFIIAKDAHLFSKWIEYRERLTRVLPQEVAIAYTRITGAIISNHSSKYRKSFIGDEDIIKRALQNEAANRYLSVIAAKQKP